MGILNVTPDSFYDQGRYFTHDRAMERAREILAEGADILDIGGEKAGPGEPVSAEDEIERVIPVVQALRRETAVPISVDTLKPSVALAAMHAGADIINSIGGFDDPELRQVAADTGAAVIIMHIKGRPRVANPHPRYVDIVTEVRDFLLARAHCCVEQGIDPNSVLIDPGPGFGKTTGHDIELLHGLSALTKLPYPVVLAASRKKFIGDVLGGYPAERLEGSLAVATWGVMHGVKVVRTHDVGATRAVCRMTESVLNPELVEGDTP